MSLDDRIAAAYEKAQVSTDPTDWRLYHALVAVRAAEIQEARRAANPPAGDTGDLPPWSDVSKAD
jgi:hypothetical protein